MFLTICTVRDDESNHKTRLDTFIERVAPAPCGSLRSHLFAADCASQSRPVFTTSARSVSSCTAHRYPRQPPPPHTHTRTEDAVGRHSPALNYTRPFLKPRVSRDEIVRAHARGRHHHFWVGEPIWPVCAAFDSGAATSSHEGRNHDARGCGMGTRRRAAARTFNHFLSVPHPNFWKQ